MIGFSRPLLHTPPYYTVQVHVFRKKYAERDDIYFKRKGEMTARYSVLLFITDQTALNQLFKSEQAFKLRKIEQLMLTKYTIPFPKLTCN